MTELIITTKGDKWESWPELIAAKNSYLTPLVEDAVQAIYKAIVDGWTLQINWSAGKDSETVLHLSLMALVRAVRSGQNISQHHFLIHSDTQIENPEIRWLADSKLEKLKQFTEQENLPLSIVIAQPGLTQSWTGRILTGRGIPTFSNSASRQCTHELKIVPSNRARAAYLKSVPTEQRNKVCMLLGSRDAESSTRKANIKKQGGHAAEVTLEKGVGRLYVIKDWQASDVWEFLLSSGSADRFALPSYLESNMETAEVYKDATGECVWSTVDKKQNEACSSRFGCAMCQAVGLDKSMTQMLEGDPEKYGYMAGLNRLQRFLSKKQWDWDSRHPMGRTIYQGGYIRIQPDVYSPAMMERILHVCCSLDYQEYKRSLITALKLKAGLIDDNEWNRRMSEPQFRLITPEKLVHVDFMWSFHSFNSRPFRALEIFHQVWEEGNLDLLDDEPDLEPVPRTPIPAALWLKVGDAWGDGTNMDGMRDHLSEMSYFDGAESPMASRVIKTSNGHRRVVRFEEDSEITVSEEAAEFIISEEYPRLREKVLNGQYTPAEAASYYLRFGAISIARGKAALYQKMMQRGQTYEEMGLTGQQSLSDIKKRTDLNVLTNDEYKAVLAQRYRKRMAVTKGMLLLDMTIKHHRHQQTPTGQWIDQCIQREQDEKERRKYATLYHRLNDAVLYHIRTACTQKIEPNPVGQQIRSATLKLVFKALRELSGRFPELAERVVGDVVKTLQGYLNDPGNWLTKVSLGDSDWLSVCHQKDPEYLGQMARRSIRMLEAVSRTDKPNTAKKEICLRIVLPEQLDLLIAA